MLQSSGSVIGTHPPHEPGSNGTPELESLPSLLSYPGHSFYQWGRVDPSAGGAASIS